MRKKLFIFDLDGTLANVYHAIHSSLNHARCLFGYPSVSFLKVKHSVGVGDQHLVEIFFPAHQAAAALAVYRKQHKKDIIKYSKALPFVKSTLARLKKEGRFIAVASNRPHYFTQKVIKTIGIGKYIDFILCADDIGRPKPDPAMLNMIVKKFGVKKSEAVYCGDMDIDLETAKRALVDAVFVKGGSSSVSVVKDFADVRVVPSLKSVLKIC